MGIDWGRWARAGATLGASELYEGPARGQKRAMDRAAAGARAFGGRMRDEYDERGRRARGNYDRFAGAIEDYERNQPRYTRDWYANRPQRTNAVSNYYRNQGAKPNYAQDYYKNYRDTDAAANQFRERQARGYYDPLADRYSSGNRAYSNSTRTEGIADQERSWSMGPTATAGRMGDARRFDKNELDQRFAERQANRNRPTRTSEVLYGLTNAVPYTERSDKFAKELGSMEFGQETGGVLDMFKSGKGETGKFLAGFDPTKTYGLGETYERLRDEGPTYEEDFYTSTAEGQNPYYEMLKGDMQKDLRRAAAARGGFVSGKALDLEQRGAARLGAEEFARRGELASMAGQARRDRLGQQLEGAGALDTHILGAQKFKGELGLGADRLLADTAGRKDEFGIQGLGMRADLAKFGDTQRLNVEDLRMRGSQFEDEFGERREDALDRLGEGLSTRGDKRLESLDRLAESADRTALDRRKYGTDVIGRADDQRFEREKAMDDLAQRYSDSRFQRDQQLDTLADRYAKEQEFNRKMRFDASGRASDEDLDYRKFDRDLARDVDEGERSWDTQDREAAGAASKEQSDFYRDRAKMWGDYGDATSRLQEAYDKAAVGALTEGEWAAIEAELKKAGIDAATIEAMKNDALSLAGTAGKAMGGGA